ncbi:MAG TPA: LysM peptidoglycan-binding domain-containing protein [Candidatus Paceibacterota bacterium]|nr:LysM peptidoglycan-binding domain-containing protein [Candidatus Paceibacterota bacterium]
MIPKKLSPAARKRTLFIIGVLLTVNVSVAHLLGSQIATKAYGSQVKGDQVTADEVGQITPNDTVTPIADDAKPEITVYAVQSGDTISEIADKFNISVQTILWANDLNKKDTIRVGQKLVILPITGIQYTVKNGDTVSGIAHKFDADQQEILDFNNIDDAKSIKPGMKLIIPDAEPLPPTTSATSKSSSSSSSTGNTGGGSSEGSTSVSHEDDGLATPVIGGVLTQGLHAVNAVDIGAPIGTPVHTVADGTVIVAKGNGKYNGGFGNFIVVSHNGFQTLYAHLSKVEVTVGESVTKGQEIGKVGSTGKSTGPHLHIEFHGRSNPYAHDKKGTRYQ